MALAFAAAGLLTGCHSGGGAVLGSFHGGAIGDPGGSGNSGDLGGQPSSSHSDQGTLSVMATDQHCPLGIAVDAHSVYWVSSSGGTVNKCDKNGCGAAPTTLVMGLDEPVALAVDEHNAYFTDNDANEVMMCPKDGCAKPTILATDPNSPLGIASDGQNVYWAVEGAAADFHDGAVMMCATGGCAAPSVFAANQKDAQDVAVDAERVYWTNAGDSTVMSAPKSGGAPTMLASGGTAWIPANIVVDAQDVYWTATTVTNSNGKVLKCAKGGCASPTELASGQAGPAGIALDGQDVYWANVGGTTINSCGLGGCPKPGDIAGNQRSPAGIAADGQSVYFTTYVGNTVMKFTFGAAPEPGGAGNPR